MPPAAGATAPPTPRRSAPTLTGAGQPGRAVAAIERHWQWALGALMLADVVVLLYLGRGLTFFFDEWDYVTHDFGGGVHSLLVAHNGHMSVFPVAVYKLLFHVVGLNHYAVFRSALIALHLICAGLVFVLVARRQSRAFALLATALILFLGAAWEDLLWAFQIDYMLSIAGGLAAWALLERRDGWGDVGATLALIVSIGSSGLGIPVLGGVIIELAWAREWRRDRRRGLVVLVPALIYILWYAKYGEDEITRNGLINSPGFAEDIAAAAFGGIAGRGLDWGRPIALLGFLAVVWRLARPRPVPARLAGLLATALFLWLLTAAARGSIASPETARYIYLGAVVIVLAAAELLRGVVFSARALAVGAIVVAIFAVTGLTALRSGADGLRTTATTVTAELGALELASGRAPVTYQPDPRLAPQILAGPYLHTVHAIGSSPADSPARLTKAAPGARAAADTVLLALDAPALTPAGGVGAGSPETTQARAPTVESANSATTTRRRGCVLVAPLHGSAATVALALPSVRARITSRGTGAVSVAVRRFGDQFVPLASTVVAHGEATLSLPPDSARAVPWRLQLSSSSALTVCAA
jgi:hypothetical protein